MSEFVKDRTKSICKECKRRKGKQSYERNKPDYVARAARWRSANLEYDRALRRKRAAERAPEIKDRRNAQARLRYHASIEKSRAYFREQYKRWYRANPEKRKATAYKATRKRQALKAGAREAGNVNYRRICERDRMICHICKTPVTRKQLHFDHVIPLSAGGPHVESNIAVAHAFCNISKGAKVLTLF